MYGGFCGALERWTLKRSPSLTMVDYLFAYALFISLSLTLIPNINIMVIRYGHNKISMTEARMMINNKKD